VIPKKSTSYSKILGLWSAIAFACDHAADIHPKALGARKKLGMLKSVMRPNTGY